MRSLPNPDTADDLAIHGRHIDAAAAPPCVVLVLLVAALGARSWSALPLVGAVASTDGWAFRTTGWRHRDSAGRIRVAAASAVSWLWG